MPLLAQNEDMDRAAPSLPRTEPDLSPTARTTVRRNRVRAVTDRDVLWQVLEDALVGHLAVVVDGVPMAVPTVIGVDRGGPDPGGTVYLHGSVAAAWVTQAPSTEVSLTVTLVDGLVLARSAFHHSFNYRSVVVIGRARLVTDSDERQRALDLVVDHIVPGRPATLRPSTRKELAATSVLALALAEASVKARSGDPVDEPEDVEAGAWAGVVPLWLQAGDVVTAADAPGTEVPPEVDRVARRTIGFRPGASPRG